MGRAAEVVDGLGRRLVRGQEDDQLLCVRGEFERLADQPELASGRMVEPEIPALRNDVPVQAPGELGAGDGCELRGEPFVGVEGWAEPQVEGPLVRDVVPVGEDRPGAGVGEDVPGEVRGSESSIPVPRVTASNALVWARTSPIRLVTRAMPGSRRRSVRRTEGRTWRDGGAGRV